MNNKLLASPPADSAWAIIDVRISKFRTIGAVSSSARFSLSEVNTLGGLVEFVVAGTDITIKVKKSVGPEVEIWLRFRIPPPTVPGDSPCMFLGMAFNELTFEKGAVGQDEFPEIRVGPIDAGGTLVREMQIRDAHLPNRMGVDYSYSIFIQNIDTGEVGVIDPPIDTEVTD